MNKYVNKLRVHSLKYYLTISGKSLEFGYHIFIGRDMSSEMSRISYHVAAGKLSGITYEPQSEADIAGRIVQV